MARFKMDNLERMSPELATKVILLHFEDAIKENSGSLDELTLDLFKINRIEFSMKKFTLKHPSDKGDIYCPIVIKSSSNPGITLRLTISVFDRDEEIVFTLRFDWEKDNRRDSARLVDYSGSTWGGSSLVAEDVVGTPTVYSNAYGHIIVKDTGTLPRIGLNIIYVKFMETLFLDFCIGKRISKFVSETISDKHFQLFGQDLVEFQQKLQQKLLDLTISPLDVRR